MKKVLVLLLILMLLMTGCGKEQQEANWSNYRLEKGDPDVYAFARGELWGVADAKKRELTEAKFDVLDRFYGDYAVAAYTDYTATPVDISGFDEYPRMYGVINRKGKTVVDFEYTKMLEQAGGFYIVEKDGKFGVMTIEGKFIFEPRFDGIDSFFGHYAIAYMKESITGEDGKPTEVMRYGLINDLGEILLPTQYDRIEANNGKESGTILTATVRGEISQFNLTDRQAVRIETGSVQNPEHYVTEKLCDDPEIYAYAVNELKGLIAGDGTVITEPIFAQIEKFQNGTAAASKYDYTADPLEFSGAQEYPRLWGVIDVRGNAAVDFTYEETIELSDDGKIILYSEKNETGSLDYGYKTIEGEIIIEPKYWAAESFDDGYAIVGVFETDPNSKENLSGPDGEYYYGVIDTSGREIIPLDYEHGERHADGTIRMRRNRKDYYFRIENGSAEEISAVQDSFSLEEYYPFTGSKVAKLDGEPSLEKRASAEYGHPRLDGATALFPVYAAFAEAVYPDETRYTPETQLSKDSLITCTKTNRAYERLAEGECDIIFAAEPSDAQIAYAKARDVEFELTPFGREAFVFIVNQENPLENISSEQLRQVYSGEITDWSGLGVENLGEIVAYQRPKNSGSQTAMEKFMGETPLMVAPGDSVAGFMDEAVVVIEYRNLPNAIGYTFRFYCTDMLGSGVKLLSVDGIAPTVENIRSGSYPVCSTLYAVTRKDEKNPNVQAFVDWILSEQGRELIEKSGYVAIDD